MRILLSPRTDAEPQLLADYLFALCENKDQISLEALTKEISEFVETDAPQLAKTIHDGLHPAGSQIGQSGPSTFNSKPIPTGPSGLSARKRRLSASGDVDMAGPDSQGNQKLARMDGPLSERDGFGGRGRGRGRGGATTSNGRKKPCFDYHSELKDRRFCVCPKVGADIEHIPIQDKGYCGRGVNCPYEHGPDTMYGMPGGMGGMPFPFMMPPGASPQGPPGAFMDPSGRPVGAGDIMQADPSRQGGPEYHPDQPGMMPMMGPDPASQGMMPFMMGMSPSGMFPGFDPGMMGGMAGGQRGRGGRQGGRGRGRGEANGRGFDDWNGQLSTRPPRDNGSSTLVVSEVPKEHLNLGSIHAEFKKFGTVTNVAVEAGAKKALVAFSTNAEAYAAWSCKESFFNDRHVKILWHRPREGQGEAGQKALDDSAPLLENLRKIDEQGLEAFQGTAKGLPTVDPEIKAQLEGVRERGLKLEKIVAEQKVLMVRFEGAKDADEKTQMRSRLKELIAESNQIKEANAGIDVAKLQSIVEAQQKARDEAKAKIAAQRKAQWESQKIKSEPSEGVHSIREMMLDQEMQEHQLEAQLEAKKEQNDDGQDEETIKLRAQLAALKSQASSMGINPDFATSTPQRPGGYRGRGRGSWRGGRGGAVAPRFLSLDNRPKSLSVTGPAVQKDESGTMYKVKDWFAELSDKMTRDPMIVDGKVVVTFTDRRSAETVRHGIILTTECTFSKS